MLGLPPILVHSTISLCNWRKLDPRGPMVLDNLTLLHSLDSSRDLEVFFLIPVLVELCSVPAVLAILTAQELLAKGDQSHLQTHLDTITTSLEKMVAQLKEMSPGCRPEIFYHQHRPLLSGWEGNPALPAGLVYEGVSLTPRKYSGGSAAQSSAVQAIDAGLGVTHAGREGQFLLRMREHYMPPNQGGLIHHISQGPSIRAACQAGSQGVKESYNKCLAALELLRTQHLILVARYITTPSHRDRGEADHLADQGTGGTQLATFLKKIRQDTADMVIT